MVNTRLGHLQANSSVPNKPYAEDPSIPQEESSGKTTPLLAVIALRMFEGPCQQVATLTQLLNQINLHPAPRL